MPAAPVRLIVADDLTGAADAAVRLALGGRSATVVPDLDGVSPALLDRADVLSMSLDTRRRPPAEVSERMHRAAQLAGARRTSPVLLKIDSTLRGHLTEEITTALAAFACTHALLTPAFPAMGRRVLDGVLVVEGPGSPKPLDVRAHLTSRGLAHVAVLPVAAATGAEPSVADLTDAIRRARERGDRILVANVAAQVDLDRLVRAGRRAGERPLWVGSAGLAEALGAGAALHPSMRPELPPAHRRAGPVVLCLGSTHPVTAIQEARLAGRSSARVLRVSAETWPGVAGALRGLSRDHLAGLVLSGGDTATAVCSTLGATAIDLGGELSCGVPWGLLRGGALDGAPVILKAGGFGDPDALVDAVDFLSATMGAHADG